MTDRSAAATTSDSVRQVLLAYAVALDRRDPDGLRACFTADAQATYSGVTLERGVEHILRHLAQIDRLEATQHFIMPMSIDVDGTAASSLSYGMAVLIEKAMPGRAPNALVRGLQYEDELVQVDGRWRIRVRRHTAVFGWVAPVGYGSLTDSPVTAAFRRSSHRR